MFKDECLKSSARENRAILCKLFRFLLRSYEKKASRVEKNEEKRIFFVKTFGSKTEKF